jgi:hypothetical protein
MQSAASASVSTRSARSIAAATAIVSPVRLAPPPDTSIESFRTSHLAAAKIGRARRLQSLYSIPDPAVRRKALESDGLLCASDPVFWIDNWAYVRWEKAPSRDLQDCPFILWPSQVELVRWLLERLAAGEVALVNKSREKGVTWLVLHLIYHRWRFHGASATLASRVEDLVDKRGDRDSLFEKVRYIHQWQPPHLREPTKNVLDQHMTFANLRNGAQLKGTSTNEDPKRGGRSEVFFVDEFHSIPPRLADALLAAQESVGKSLWLVGNPDQPSHPAERLRSQLLPHQVRDMPWQADPYLDAAWRKSRELPQGPLTGEQARQEYDCEAGAVSGIKIFPSLRTEVVGYHEDSPEWQRVQQHARAAWQVAGGWDFGSGASLLANVNAVIDWTDNPRNFHIWLDAARLWRQEQWSTAAADVHEMLADYRGPKIQFGDPAGKSKESDQSSWITNLRSAGVPVWPLPYTINSSVNRDWAIRHTQFLIDAGRFHVNVDRYDCALVLAAMKAWERDVPLWVTDLDVVSRAHVPPKKDGNSHPCEAVLYLVSGVLIMCRQLLSAGIGGAGVNTGDEIVGSERDDDSRRRGGSGPGSGLVAPVDLTGLTGVGSRDAMTAIFREMMGGR